MKSDPQEISDHELERLLDALGTIRQSDFMTPDTRAMADEHHALFTEEFHRRKPHLQPKDD